MLFLTVPPVEAEGCILVHSLRAGGRLLKKGRALGKSDVQQLTDAAITSVTVARLQPDDVPEDEAAARIANNSMRALRRSVAMSFSSAACPTGQKRSRKRCAKRCSTRPTFSSCLAHPRLRTGVTSFQRPLHPPAERSCALGCPSIRAICC